MGSLTFLLLLFQTASLQPISALVQTRVVQHSAVDQSTILSGDPSIEVASMITSPEALEDSIQSLYQSIGLARYELSYNVFKYAMTGYLNLREQHRLSDKHIISVIDFTMSSREKRFFTIDLDEKVVKFHTYVSHGKNTGEDMAKSFSNVMHSNASSLGFYVTGETYVGSKGYSLKLDGIDKGYNDNMRDRAVVMHNADYVSESWIKKYGRLGRSQGCPALPQELGKQVINAVKDRTMIFAFFNDEQYLASSPYLNTSALFSSVTASVK